MTLKEARERWKLNNPDSEPLSEREKKELEEATTGLTATFIRYPGSRNVIRKNPDNAPKETADNKSDSETKNLKP